MIAGWVLACTWFFLTGQYARDGTTATVNRFHTLAGWRPLAAIPRVAGLNFFGLVDFLSANVLMPISALLVSVFLGWRMGARVPAEEFSGLSPVTRSLLVFALRYLCPVGITVVLVTGLAG